MFADIYNSIYGFYNSEEIEESLKKLFLTSFKSDSIFECFGLERESKDHYFKYVNHGPICELNV